MKLVCGPDTSRCLERKSALRVILYGQPGAEGRGSAGDAAKYEIRRRRLQPTPRAWDLLSIALSVVTADFAAYEIRARMDGRASLKLTSPSWILPSGPARRRRLPKPSGS